MALTGEQRAELLAVAETMMARLATMFATHRALLQVVLAKTQDEIAALFV